MEVRRIGPDGGLIREIRELRGRVSRQETRPAGNIVIRETLTTTDPIYGTTTIGQLPNGSFGFQPFIGDITPPPVATTPVVSSQPGYITVAWDGLFVNNEEQPRDFEVLNVWGHKMSGTNTVYSLVVGAIRLSSDTLIVTQDFAAIGETWQFSFESEDYNANRSVRSARSASVTMTSAVTDSGVNAALGQINTQVISAQSAAASAQTSANNAQQAANTAAQAASDAAGLAASKSKVLIQSTAPAAADQNSNVLWIDTTNGLNAPKRWSGSAWVVVTDKAATDAAAAAAAAQTKADQAFNNAQTAANAAGQAQSTADGKNTSYYLPSAPSGSGFKVGDQWFDTSNSYALKVWNGSAWITAQDSALAKQIADSKALVYTQATVPPVSAQVSSTVWYDTSLGINKIVQKYWNGSAWTAVADKTATDAASVADSKGETIYSTTAPAAAKQLPQNLWVDTTGGVNIYKRWDGSAWVVAADARIASTATAVTAADSKAQSALDTATAKGITYTQSVTPPVSARLPQNLWNDTSLGDNNVVVKYWNGTAWSPLADKAATDAANVAASKGETIYSTTEPTVAQRLPQNTWVDTTGGLNISKRWDGASWVVVADSRIASTATAVTAADSKAQNALDTATTKGITYTQSVTPPVSARLPQNIWNDTSLGLNNIVVKYWDGSAWTALADKTATDAAAVAAAKTKTYFQTTQPSNAGNTTGDIWFDTANGNKPYVWNGSSWTVAQDTTVTKSLFSSFSTDIDNTQPNKWLYTRYNKAMTPAVVPGYLDVAGFAGTSSLVADGTNLVMNVGDNYVGQLRTIVNVASSKTIAITATHDDAAQIYVDGVSVYTKTVYTQNSPISFTLSAGWHVLDFMWAELTGGDGWYNISPTISSQVTSMFAPVSMTALSTAVSAAQTSADSAASSAQTAMNAQSYSLNASFDDWTGTTPTGFSQWSSSVPVKETTIVRRAPFAARFNVPDTATQQGFAYQTIVAHAPNLEYFTVEVEFYLVSGVLSGAGVIVDWNGLTNNRSTVNLDTEVPGAVTGKWYKVSKVVRRPTNSTGTWSGMGGYLLANWSSFGGGAKNIVFDWFNVRPSTTEEILAFGAPADAQAKATAAQTAAISAAATDAQTKANTAKADAILAAATDAQQKAATAEANAKAAAAADATSKANAAQSAAISAAASDAQNKASAAQQAAIDAAAADAAAKAAQAQQAAINSAATDAQSKADAAKQAAIDAAAVTAQLKADGAKQSAIDAAAADAASKANAAQAAATAAAAADATAKANQAKTDALTAAATDAQTRATQAKTDAISAAALDATAKSDAAQMAAIQAQAYQLNPSFEDWTGTIPAYYTTFVTNPTKETTTTRTGKYAVRFDCTDATTQRGLQFNAALAHAPYFEYLTVELDVRLDSGSSFGGAGVLVDWQGMTGGNRATISLAAEIPAPVTGRWYRLVKVIRKPATASGTFTSYSAWLMGQYGTGMGTQAVKNVIFDWINVRPATNEEITAYGTPASIQSLSDTVNTKTKSWFQPTQPPLTGNTTGDLWFDTSNNNKMYIWNGTWAVASDQRIESINTAVTAAQASANGKNKVIYSTSAASGTNYTAGDTWFQRDVSNNVIAMWEFTTSWQSRQLSHQVQASIDAAKISVGVLDVANRISANAITASKLTVSDMEEFIPNPFFHPAGEPVTQGTIVSTASTPVSAGAPYPNAVLINTRDNHPFSYPNIPVKPGDQFYLEVWVASASTAICNFNLYMFGSTTPNGGLSAKTSTGNVVPGTTWRKVTWNYTVPAVSPGFQYIRPVLQINNSGGETAAQMEWYATGFSMKRKNTGELIVDGAIKAGSAIIDVLAVSRAMIADLAINTAKIDDLAVKTAKIDDLAVTSAKILELDAQKIKTGLLDADRIGVNTIKASKLDVTLGGGNLVANSSFEADSDSNGLADGWAVWTRGAGDASRTFTCTRPAGLFPGSTYAQRVTSNNVSNTESSSIQATTLFSIAPGASATISIYGRASVAGTFPISIRCEDDTAAYKGDAGFNASFTTTTQRFSGTVVIPAGTTRGKITVSSPSVSSGHWFEIDGVKAELGDMPSAWTPMSSELLPGTIIGTMLSATAIDGMVITGATVQTTQTANRGIKLTSAELAGYDNAGTKNFSLTTAGALTLKGDITSGSTITGAIVTGSTVQTESTASRGIKLTTTELAGYDGAGVKNFSLTTGGSLTLMGAITSGSTITGATVTGSTVQTTATLARGIKLTTTELAGYDNVGTKNFSLLTDGTLSVRGSIESGSVIKGATLAAAGGGIETTSTANRGVKLKDTGIVTYDASGNMTFKVDATTGLVEAPGLKANSITGDMIAAGTITVQNLLVGDFTNLVDDADLNGAGWFKRSGVTTASNIVTTVGLPGQTWKLDGVGTEVSVATKAYFSVTPGSEYRVTLRAQNQLLPSAALGYFRVYWFTETGAAASTAYSEMTIPQGVWNNFAATFVPPADARRGVPTLMNGATATGGSWWFGMPTIRRRNGGDLIVDGAIDGKVITGATIQTEVTASRGIKLTATELAGYDGAGNKNFSLTSAGALTILGAIKAGSSIEGATLSAAGGYIQTSTTAARGIKFNNTGMWAYDTAGNQTFKLDAATGVVELPGLKANSITSTSLAATAIDGMTITGATIQTVSTANRGIKLTSTELAGYDGVGNKNFSLTSAGALTLIGAIQSGSTITGTQVTGSSGIQTSTSATAGVKINNLGIVAYDGSNNMTFKLDATTGYLELPGIKANSINGDRLVAGSIGTDRLVVGDMTNYVIDPYMSGSGKISGVTYLTSAATSVSSGAPYEKLIQANVRDIVENPSQMRPVSGGETFYAEAWVRADATAAKNIYLGIWCASDDNSNSWNTSSTLTPSTSSWSTPAAAQAGWVKLTGTFVVPATVAAGKPTTKARAWIQINGTTGVDTQGWFITGWEVRRQADVTTVADGVITTKKIVASGIDGGAITAGTLTAAQMKGKSITVDKLVVSSTDNLIVEADFSNGGASWGTLNANKAINATAGRGGVAAFRVTGSTALQSVTNLVNKVTVGSEDRFRGSFYIKSSVAAASGVAKLRLNAYTTATANTSVLVATSPAVSANVWTLVEGYSPALPAGTIAIEFVLDVQNAATGTITDIDYVAVTRAADGRLVVDGAIDGKTITGALIRTAATNNRVQLDSTGLRAFDSLGNETVSISGLDGTISATGQLSAYGVTKDFWTNADVTVRAVLGNRTARNSWVGYDTLQPGVYFERQDGAPQTFLQTPQLYSPRTTDIGVRSGHIVLDSAKPNEVSYSSFGAGPGSAGFGTTRYDRSINEDGGNGLGGILEYSGVFSEDKYAQLYSVEGSQYYWGDATVSVGSRNKTGNGTGTGAGGQMSGAEMRIKSGYTDPDPSTALVRIDRNGQLDIQAVHGPKAVRISSNDDGKLAVSASHGILLNSSSVSTTGSFNASSYKLNGVDMSAGVVQVWTGGGTMGNQIAPPARINSWTYRADASTDATLFSFSGTKFYARDTGVYNIFYNFSIAGPATGRSFIEIGNFSSVDSYGGARGDFGAGEDTVSTSVTLKLNAGDSFDTGAFLTLGSGTINYGSTVRITKVAAPVPLAGSDTQWQSGNVSLSGNLSVTGTVDVPLRHYTSQGITTYPPNAVAWGPGIFVRDSAKSFNDSFITFPANDQMKFTESGLYLIHLEARNMSTTPSNARILLQNADRTVTYSGRAKAEGGVWEFGLTMPNYYATAGEILVWTFAQNSGGNQTWDCQLRVTKLK